MTILFRMSVAMLFQSMAMLVRFVVFLFLAFIRPFDYLAESLARVAYWLAVDKDTLSVVAKHQQGNKDE